MTSSATRALGLAALLTVTGTLHFVRPAPFVSIVPKSLPKPEFLVAVSGVAELASAALLATPRARGIGGLAAAATFIAVFPANVSMALRANGRSRRYRTLTWLRLPIQWPLIAWGFRVARDARIPA